MKNVQIKPLAMNGGESVYCIHEAQQDKARSIFAEADESSPLKLIYKTCLERLDRNERAALAFLLIEELRT